MQIEKGKNEKKIWDMSDLGNTSEVKQLVSAGGWMNMNCVAGQYQSTPLYQAAYHGHTDVVKVLLHGGADPDKANSSGNTPLHRAASGNHKKTVQLLLHGKADPNKMNQSGITPLHMATHYTALHDYTEVVQVLLDAGADPDQAAHNGISPLFRCKYFGRKEMVQLLLERGADPNKMNRMEAREGIVQLLQTHFENK